MLVGSRSVDGTWDVRRRAERGERRDKWERGERRAERDKMRDGREESGDWLGERLEERGEREGHGVGICSGVCSKEDNDVAFVDGKKMRKSRPVGVSMKVMWTLRRKPSFPRKSRSRDRGG